MTREPSDPKATESGEPAPRSRSAAAGRRAFGAFGVRPFRALWVATTCNGFGFWMTLLALQWHVVRVSDGDAFQLGAIYFMALIPLLVLSPFAGALADTRDRTVTLAVSMAGLSIAAGVGAVVLLLYPELPFIGLAPIALLLGIFNTFQATASQSLVPTWLEAGMLSSGISMTAMSNNVARMVGPAIGGPLLLLGQPWTCLAIYAVAAAIATGMVFRLRAIAPPPARVRQPRYSRFDVLAGVRHARAQRPAFAAIVLTGATALLGSTFVSALPALTTNELQLGPVALSVLVGLSGAGAMIGSFVTASRHPQATLRFPAVLAIALAITLVGVGLSPALWLTAPLVACAGALSTMTMNAMNVEVQHAVLDSHRGRVTALFMLSWGGLLPLGSLALGALGAWAGIGVGLIASAVMLAVCGTAAAVSDWRRREA